MKAKQSLPLLLLFFVSLVPLLDLFHPGLPITHDGQDQVARIANFYQSLSEGNLVPRWAANLNWGYGHPILMFLYPLSSYFASFFHFLGFSFVDATKIIFGLSFILSGVSMFLWIKEIWGREAGFVAGLLYSFAPYRFVDLYVRGAIGECWAFVWPPLICYFLLKKNFTGIALTIATLILSHNALALIFLPVVFGYMVYLIYISNQKLLSTFYFLLSTFLGFFLSAFFWLPAFFEGKYTLRDIVTENQIAGFDSFFRLIWSNWSYGGTGLLSVQLGILQWLGIILAPLFIWLLWKKKEKIYILLLFLFIYFWIAIFLMLPVSKGLYLAIPLLQKFQFTWRFLSLAIFPPAVFMAALVYLLPGRLKLFTVSCLLIVALLINKDYWHAKNFLLKPDSFYTGIYPGTTDTGESSPRWSVRFMEKEAKAHLEVISGKATIKEIARTSNKHVYNIEAETKTRLRENTLYFPGWNILVDDRPVTVEFQDPENRGLMTFFVPAGKQEVAVVFKDTKVRKLAELVSFISLTILVMGSVLTKRNRWKKFQ